MSNSSPPACTSFNLVCQDNGLHFWCLTAPFLICQPDTERELMAPCCHSATVQVAVEITFSSCRDMMREIQLVVPILYSIQRTKGMCSQVSAALWLFPLGDKAKPVCLKVIPLKWAEPTSEPTEFWMQEFLLVTPSLHALNVALKKGFSSQMCWAKQPQVTEWF